MKFVYPDMADVKRPFYTRVHLQIVGLHPRASNTMMMEIFFVLFKSVIPTVVEFEALEGRRKQNLQS